MLALEVGDEELTRRLLKRGEGSGRADDANEDVIRRRIQEYNNKTLPLKNYYNEQGKFHSIKGVGSIDEIFKSLTDRIVFLNAEMDLTALESDIEHLDMTIQDFDVANDIAPELLLEIDAIKRAEAEEEEEERVSKKSKGKSQKEVSGSKKVENLKKVESSKPVKKTAGKNKESGNRKTVQKKTSKPAKKPVAKKPAKKAAPKKSVKKSAPKKTVKKAAKKVAPKKPAKKVVAKKGKKK
jgi:hypothetical protein